MTATAHYGLSRSGAVLTPIHFVTWGCLPIELTLVKILRVYKYKYSRP
jgi:hypothetical protein